MDLRRRMGAILDEISDEAVRELIEESLSADKLVWAHCPNCAKKVRVDYPDLDKRAKLLAILLDQAKGKPVETKRVEVLSADVDLEDLSDEELQAVIDGTAVFEDEIEEAEASVAPAMRELPPAGR